MLLTTKHCCLPKGWGDLCTVQGREIVTQGTQAFQPGRRSYCQVRIISSNLSRNIPPNQPKADLSLSHKLLPQPWSLPLTTALLVFRIGLLENVSTFSPFHLTNIHSTTPLKTVFLDLLLANSKWHSISYLNSSSTKATFEHKPTTLGCAAPALGFSH